MFKTTKRALGALAALAALALGGSAIAGAASSSTNTAASSTTAAVPTSQGTPSSSSPPAMPAHGSAAHENTETAVTGTNATKAQEAAVKSVGSGKAGAVTTDFTKDGYEVTVTKSDGTSVDVRLDSSFNVQQGPGGDHAGSPPAG